MRGMKSYFLSRYALTSGVLAVEAEGVEELNGHSFVYPVGYFKPYRLGVDIHETEAAAKAAAEVMRKKRLKSLKAKVKELEALTFEVTQ